MYTSLHVLNDNKLLCVTSWDYEKSILRLSCNFMYVFIHVGNNWRLFWWNHSSFTKGKDNWSKTARHILLWHIILYKRRLRTWLQWLVCSYVVSIHSIPKCGPCVLLLLKLVGCTAGITRAWGQVLYQLYIPKVW